MMDADAGQLLDLCLVEVRNIQEGRLVEPLTLDEHLQHMNQVHGGLKMALVRRDINHALKDTDRLIQDTLCVGVEVGDWEWATVKVRLK